MQPSRLLVFITSLTVFLDDGTNCKPTKIPPRRLCTSLGGDKGGDSPLTERGVPAATHDSWTFLQMSVGVRARLLAAARLGFPHIGVAKPRKKISYPFSLELRKFLRTLANTIIESALVGQPSGAKEQLLEILERLEGFYRQHSHLIDPRIGPEHVWPGLAQFIGPSMDSISGRCASLKTGVFDAMRPDTRQRVLNAVSKLLAQTISAPGNNCTARELGAFKTVVVTHLRGKAVLGASTFVWAILGILQKHQPEIMGGFIGKKIASLTLWLLKRGLPQHLRSKLDSGSQPLVDLDGSRLYGFIPLYVKRQVRFTEVSSRRGLYDGLALARESFEGELDATIDQVVAELEFQSRVIEQLNYPELWKSSDRQCIKSSFFKSYHVEEFSLWLDALEEGCSSFLSEEERVSAGCEMAISECRGLYQYALTRLERTLEGVAHHCCAALKGADVIGEVRRYYRRAPKSQCTKGAHTMRPPTKESPAE